ncbi:MAG: hypothetical protein ABIE47_02360 [Pseudomonadota bacterium]
MVKKKILKKHKIEGKVIYKSLDQITAKFSMEDVGQMGNRNIEFPADVIPEEFDPTLHEITGSFSVEFQVSEKN